jgi:hypothetical protein
LRKAALRANSRKCRKAGFFPEAVVADEAIMQNDARPAWDARRSKSPLSVQFT